MAGNLTLYVDIQTGLTYSNLPEGKVIITPEVQAKLTDAAKIALNNYASEYGQGSSNLPYNLEEVEIVETKPAEVKVNPSDTELNLKWRQRNKEIDEYINSEYSPEHQFNAYTFGGFNNLSPTLWIGRAFDFILGDNMWDSWMRGNSGIAPDKLYKKHPYLATGINIIVDSATGISPRPFKIGPIQRYNSFNSSWKRWGAESLVNMDDPQYVYKVPIQGTSIKWRIPFMVRNKLIANEIPEHVPYEYVKTIKVDNKYFPVFKQLKVFQRELSDNEWTTLLDNIRAHKGWLARPKLALAKNYNYRIQDYSPRHNVGILNDKPVIFDALIMRNRNPLEGINRHFVSNPKYMGLQTILNLNRLGNTK